MNPGVGGTAVRLASEAAPGEDPGRRNRPEGTLQEDHKGNHTTASAEKNGSAYCGAPPENAGAFRCRAGNRTGAQPLGTKEREEF